jgi:23S rRNA pseudouridine1911/1915/1917 synthase
MPANFNVTDATELLKFLFAQMPEKSRASVKALLAHRLVLVDGQPVTQFNHPLAPGQVVSIRRPGEAETGQGRGLKIVFEDAHLIVIEKRAGLLSIATDLEKEKTAYSLLSDHVKKSNPRNRIFVVHRLDRETSGLMMFAKSQDVQQKLQDAWPEAVMERTYIAVVDGQVTEPKGTITSWLTESKSLIMRSSSTPNEGQKAVTHYRVAQSSRLHSLLELNLETGRKNQIRVHMQDLGHSIVGDKKYGAASDPLHRLALHARVLAFRHPITAASLRFESPMPPEFSRLLQPQTRPSRS